MTSADRDKLFRRAAVGLVFGVLGCLFGHLGDAAGAMSTALLGGALGVLLGVLLGGLWRTRPAPPPLARRCERCQAAVTLHVTDARGGSIVGEAHLCEEHGRLYLASKQPPSPPGRLPRRRSEGILASLDIVGLSATLRQGSAGRLPGEVEAEIVRVIMSEVNALQRILLREVDGGRTFTLTVNSYLAFSIDFQLRKQLPPWPMTHDCWAASIAALGGKVLDVVISDLREQVYHARIRILQGERLAEVDVPPSDGLVLALACGVPILVAERLLAGS